MGMSASQARLLSITARQNDVEFKAQAIQQAKIQLATQQDRVYEEYQAALDAQTLSITSINPLSGEKSTIAATFNNLFSKNRVRPAINAEYALFDNKGRLVVEDDVYQNYYAFINSHQGFYEATPQAFAMYMLMGSNANWITTDPNDPTNQWCTITEAERYAYFQMNATDSTYNNAQKERLQELRTKILELIGEPADNTSDPNYNTYENYARMYVDASGNSVTENLSEEDKAKYYELLNEYQNILYTSTNGQGENDVYSNLKAQMNGVNVDLLTDREKEFDSSLFEYYAHLFQTIQSCGGCISIEQFDGFNGDASNDSEWLTGMISSGLMSISIIDVDKKGNISFNGTSPSSDGSLLYKNTSDIDSTAVKKAEAKYNHALKEIDRKDKRFDLELSKLDAERNALKTEHDSVKKVITDNIERSFTIFS